MSNITNNITSLPLLIDSPPLTLLYALPLLLASIPLAFAGTFLTLFRTASFKPLGDNPNTKDFVKASPTNSNGQDDGDKDLLAQFPFPGAVGEWEKMIMRSKSQPKKPPAVIAPTPYPGVPSPRPLPKWRQAMQQWRLEGGAGGLLAGFAVGVHLTALLSLATAHAHPTYHLPPSAFLFLWLFMSTCTTLLGGRFRGFAMFLISNGGSFALSILLSLTLSTMPHTTLILLALISLVLPIPYILTLLPISANKPHPLTPPSERKWSRNLRVVLEFTSRLSTTPLGTLTMLESIAVLSKPTIPGWDNPFSVFFENATSQSPNGKQLALTIFGWILLLVGIATDWALSRFIGASNSQEWDAYLATYTQNLPDRAGHFEQAPTILQRLERVLGGRSKEPELDTDLEGNPYTKEKGKPAFFKRHSPGKYGQLGRGEVHRSKSKGHVNFDHRHQDLLDDEFDSASDTEVDLDVEDKEGIVVMQKKNPYAAPPHRHQHRVLFPEQTSTLSLSSPSSPPPRANLTSKRDEPKLKSVEFDFEQDLLTSTRALQEGVWKPGFLTSNRAPDADDEGESKTKKKG